MHELGIISNLFVIIAELAAEHDLAKITRIKLKIGKLQQIIPDMFALAFETVAQGTNAEGAVLDVEYTPVKMRCQSCGHEFLVAEHIYICPQCAATKLTLLEGMEILLESLEGDQKSSEEPERVSLTPETPAKTL